MIADASVTFCYSGDSAVHFDREIVCSYIREFARVMRPGASAFLHHSNLGEKASPKIRDNPGWRSNMDAALAARTAAESGLSIIGQHLLDWGQPEMDCISLFHKP